MLLLPPEILNLIVSCASPEDLCSIVRLNRMSHDAYSKLLYRDIYIWTPRQLVKLYQSANVAQDLSYTSRLSMSRAISMAHYWRRVHAEFTPAEYLGRVLAMVTSVRELSFDYWGIESHAIDMLGREFKLMFGNEILMRAKDPLFLPCLARIEASAVRSMIPLCQGRPVESISHIRESDLTIDLLPSHLHPADVSPTRLSVNTVVFTEPQLNFRASVAAALGISRAASEYGLVVKHFKITVVGSRRITGQSTPPDQVNWVSMWAWTIAKRDDYKHLESLHLDFDPPLDVNYPTEQQHIIERAMDFGLSKLTYAVMGSPEVQWRRHVERRVDSASNQLPDWTPRPNLGGCKVYTWWLRESGIGLAKVPEDAFHGVITRLRGIMLTRWDDELVPSVEGLQMSLKYRLVEGESERVREQWASYGARTA